MAEVAPGGVNPPVSTGVAAVIVTPSSFMLAIARQRAAASVFAAKVHEEIASIPIVSMKLMDVTL
jgi:hypothetical protein